MDRGNQRPVDTHSKIPARRRQGGLAIIVGKEIVVDVNATDKSTRAINHTELAVTTRNTAFEPGVKRTIMHPGGGKVFLQLLAMQTPCPEPVIDHTDRNTARSGSLQSFAHQNAGVVETENIGLEINLGMRLIYRCNQRRKKLDATMEQVNLVGAAVTDQAHVDDKRKVLIMGA